MSSQTGKTPDALYMCDLCEAESTNICRNCYQSVCNKCKEIYDTDLCSKTKTQHIFKELKKWPADENTLSSQHGATVNEAMTDEGKEWSCSRCTYLNPPDFRICTMCASSRGYSSVDQTDYERLVCSNCTFHNKAGTKVCKACHKTLDLRGYPETFLRVLRSTHRDEFHHRAAMVKYPALNDPMSSQPEKAVQKDLNTICYSCESDGAIICQNCDRFVCGKCREIYLCSATKGQHIYEITDLEQRSAEGMADEETELGLGPVIG